VWTVFGVGSAIIAGDALLALALRVMLDAGPGGTAEAARALVVATEAMIGGQAVDIASETRLDLTIEECVAMEAAKTGALLACASSVGAILAGADASIVTALREYGQHLGLAFQAVDDLLGIWGDPDVTGKPAWSDLRSRKKTLPIVDALTGGSPAAQPLRELFSRDELNESQIARAAELIEQAGGRESTEAAAEAHYQRALAALGTVELARSARDELVDVARFVTTREH
jgi:geranylgeranyl diphosphate synthase type I